MCEPGDGRSNHGLITDNAHLPDGAGSDLLVAAGGCYAIALNRWHVRGGCFCLCTRGCGSRLETMAEARSGHGREEIAR